MVYTKLELVAQSAPYFAANPEVPELLATDHDGEFYLPQNKSHAERAAQTAGSKVVTVTRDEQEALADQEAADSGLKPSQEAVALTALASERSDAEARWKERFMPAATVTVGGVNVPGVPGETNAPIGEGVKMPTVVVDAAEFVELSQAAIQTALKEAEALTPEQLAECGDQLSQQVREAIDKAAGTVTVIVNPVTE